MDICFAFDCSGSMTSVIQEVQRKVNETSTYLFQKIPNLRISCIAFSDYCDGDKCLNKLDFTSDQKKIYEFVSRDHSAYGGDAEECYEYVLNQAKTLDWRSGPKALVLIGDCGPHLQGYYLNPKWTVSAKLPFSGALPLDWRQEAKDLVKDGVSIYPIKALKYEEPFYQTLADLNTEKVPLLKLSNFADITQILTAITMAKVGKISEYTEELKESGEKLTEGVIGAIRSLSSYESKPEEKTKPISVVKAIHRDGFVVLDVDYTTPIKEFVDKSGLKYKAGHGFYQIKNSTKKLTSSSKVVIMNKNNGLIQETPLRDLRSLLKHNYVFVQSHSYNRKLLGGSKLLYRNA